MSKKSKFKISDEVYLKESVIKWYLSNDGQEAFFPPSGVMSKSDEVEHNKAVTTMLTLGIKNDISGVIIAEHYVGTIYENYKVLILGTTFNIKPKNLRKA